MNKAEKWLSRAMLPMVVGGCALAWLALRPCEPRAQAAEAPVLQVGTVEIVGEFVPEVDVESLPRVRAQSLAHTSAKTARPSEKCGWYNLQSRASSPTLRDDAPEVTGRVWTCR